MNRPAPAHQHQPAVLRQPVMPRPNRLFQTSTMAAILDAVYDGDVSVADLLRHGDFGVGTFDALDGEMIISEGIVRQFRSEGQANEVHETQRTPFACVTRFLPEDTFSLVQPLDKTDFESLINERIGNPNVICAVRFTGDFIDVQTRTVFVQSPPYPKMLDVVARQPTMAFGPTRGTMLGFRSPHYMQGLSVAGFHLHFLDQEARRGGHVLDYRVGRGLVELAVISDIELRLPRTMQFAEADLNPADLHEAIRIAEGE